MSLFKEIQRKIECKLMLLTMPPETIAIVFPEGPHYLKKDRVKFHLHEGRTTVMLDSYTLYDGPGYEYDKHQRMIADRYIDFERLA